MMSKTYTNPHLDTTVNFWRNAAFTGALLWGFHGSWKRAAAVSGVILPLISVVGRLRSTDQCIFCGKWCVVYHENEKTSFHFPTTVCDPIVHLIDVAMILGTKKWVLTSPLAILWFTTRLVGLWPREKFNSRHHDSPAQGAWRIYSTAAALSKKLAW
jgi:hypothetical protein